MHDDGGDDDDDDDGDDRRRCIYQRFVDLICILLHVVWGGGAGVVAVSLCDPGAVCAGGHNCWSEHWLAGPTLAACDVILWSSWCAQKGLAGTFDEAPSAAKYHQLIGCECSTMSSLPLAIVTN
jgi:hypothetical protein